MSARFLQPGQAVAVPELRPARRQKKNWLHVNIGESEAKELRALAECWGLDLRTFLEHAVRSYRLELEQKLNLSALAAAKMTRSHRAEFDRRFRMFERAVSGKSEKLN